jgi:uridine kinase
VSSDAADQVLELVRSRPPTLGASRLICVDGPAGSGKTTLAGDISQRIGTPVVHMDDLYPGWGGLPEVDAQLETLLRPLAQGRAGSYRRYDWHQAAFAETVTVPPTDLLVVEGVGSGSQVVADLVTVLVWIEAPYELRMRRGIERDGEAFAPYWLAWAESERAHFAANGTRHRADLILDSGDPSLP